MILRKAFVVLFVVLFLAAPAFAADVNGVKLPDKVQVNGQDLTFNGGGVRTAMGFEVYVVALYLKQKSADAAAIVAADEPVDVKIEITSFMVTQDNMASGFMEAFKQTAQGDIAPLKAKIDTFAGTFKGLREHDVYDFAYVPGKGVEISVNGAASSVIEGLDFKKALYGIWLGDKPVQQDLKARMLAK
ncbi:MAG: chalcone isomerase family protein [Syntrophobacteraceae bacterium]|jgi:hypothetical protein